MAAKESTAATAAKQEQALPAPVETQAAVPAVQKSALPALPDPASLKEIFESNFEGITPSFETVKIPTGGGLFWAVPDEEGETAEKELVGVILDHYAVRAFWEKKFGEGTSGPPDCSSLDGKTGSKPRSEAGEFGECATCKWSQFGTAIKQDGSVGRGQRCQFRHRIFLLMPNKGIFPYLIPLSATSATKKYEGSFSTYVVKLGGKLKKVHDVVTKIKLKSEKNPDGIAYALAQFFSAGDLSEAEKKQVEFLRANLRAAMRNRPFEMDEVETESRGNGGSAPAESASREPDPWDR